MFCIVNAKVARSGDTSSAVILQPNLAGNRSTVSPVPTFHLATNRSLCSGLSAFKMPGAPGAAMLTGILPSRQAV